MGREHLQNADVSSGSELERMRSDRARPGRSGSARSETFDCSQAADPSGPAAPETGAVRLMVSERGCVEDQPQPWASSGLLRLIEDDTAALRFMGAHARFTRVCLQSAERDSASRSNVRISRRLISFHATAGSRIRCESQTRVPTQGNRAILRTRFRQNMHHPSFAPRD